MKNIKLLAFSYSICVILALFWGCSEENNPLNNNPPPSGNDSLIFSLDSIAIYGLGGADSWQSSSCATDTTRLKVMFETESNIAPPDTFYLRLNCNDTTGTSYYWRTQNYDSLNIPLTFNFTSHHFRPVTGTFGFGSAFGQKYFRVKNIKVFKVQ